MEDSNKEEPVDQTSSENIDLSDDDLKNSPDESSERKLSFVQRRAVRMAEIPWIHLSIAMIVSIVLSVIAFTVGGFDASVDNAGRLKLFPAFFRISRLSLNLFSLCLNRMVVSRDSHCRQTNSSHAGK